MRALSENEKLKTEILRLENSTQRNAQENEQKRLEL
jgi:hypothetical protein